MKIYTKNTNKHEQDGPPNLQINEKSKIWQNFFFIHNRTKKPMTAGQNVNILKRNTKFSNQKKHQTAVHVTISIFQGGESKIGSSSV